MHFGDPVYAVAFDPTGEYVLVGGKSKAIQLYRHSIGKAVTEYAGHGWEVLDISVSACGSYFLSGGGDRTAVLWDVQSGRTIRRLAGHLSRINSVVCCAQHSHILATGSYDRTVRLHDKRVFSRFPVQILDDADDSVESIDIRSPYIAVASADGFVRVYDGRKGRLHVDAVGFPDIVKSARDYAAVMRVRVGVDGAYYAASAINGRIKLVDLQSGQVLQSFEALQESDLRANGLLFDKNEERILFGGKDGCVHAWDTVTGEQDAKTAASDSPILSLAFSPKKNLLAIGSLSGEVRVQKA